MFYKMIWKHCFFAALLIISYFDGTFAGKVKRQQNIEVPQNCLPLEEFPNGDYIVLQEEEGYTVGSPIPNNAIVVFVCKENYELSPPNIVVACVDGYWNATIPTCVEGSLNEAVDEVANENNECGYWDKGYQAPWHVGIYKKENEKYLYLCGGSIVSSNVIVTAAHCFTNENNKKINPSDLYIGAGKTRSDYDSPIDWASQHSQVKKYTIPQNYKGVQSNLEGDLGLLILEKPFNLGYYVHPICVDWENKFENQQLTPGNIGYVQGWGYSDLATKTPSTTLQQLGVPFVTKEECLKTVPKSFQNYVTDDKFCAGYTNGSCICNGDDGGGLVFGNTERGATTYYIRGLVSIFPQTNGACDIYQYGVYTKISSYKDFIQQVVNENKVKKINN